MGETGRRRGGAEQARRHKAAATTEIPRWSKVMRVAATAVACISGFVPICHGPPSATARSARRRASCIHRSARGFRAAARRRSADHLPVQYQYGEAHLLQVLRHSFLLCAAAAPGQNQRQCPLPRTASKAYYKQLEGASKDGLAVPRYVFEIWNALIQRAVAEKSKVSSAASHFMVLVSNQERLKYLSMFS